MIQTLYSDIRPQLRTGDLVLFSGSGILSASIKLFTRSEYSHIGMVLRLEHDFLAIWESTTLSPIVDMDTGLPTKGVRVVPLSESIRSAKKVVIRQLLDTRITDLDVARLMQLRKEFVGRPYEQHERELIKAAYDGPGGRNSPDLSSIFCSELVAAAYQRIGILDPEDTPANEFTPGDFSEKRSHKLILLRGRLGPETPICP